MRSQAMWVAVAFLGFFLAARAVPSHAADHEDSPSVKTDPSTDFGDVMAWMSSDAQRVHLLASVVRHATGESRFSDAAVYVFHTRSSSAFLDE